MAMRENTGLQIALILFVMITVVLAVTTYINFNNATEANKKEEQIRDELAARTASIDDLNVEIATLRGMMGYKPTVEGGPVVLGMEKNFKADMAMFGEGYKEKRDYRVLPQYLSGKVVGLNQDLVKANERASSLVAQVEEARKQEQVITAKYLASQKAAADDLAKMTVDFTGRREQLVTDVDGIQQAFAESSRANSSLKATKDKEIDVLIQRIAKLNLLNTTLRKKIDAKESPGSGSTERPDGKVTWVSQRGGTVYLNLGSEDGLQRSTMFTVYDAGTVNLSQAEAKASVEVTTIRGPHLCEARIVEDQLSNPILSQDMVFSPVWNPGQKTHFALVGFMDVDNDGNSDRRLVRNLISQNGGAIDAEVLDNGEVEGRLTINTRYLVQGERANEKSNTDTLRASSQMLKDASDLGIETISVERLLSDMGWRGSERTVGAGSSPTGGEFRPQPKGPQGSGDSGFKPRTRPGASQRNSAY